MKHSPPKVSQSSGFSLIELLVSMTILSAMLLMFVGILDQTQTAWQSAQGRVSQFREARRAYDILTKNLSQATLNPYYEAYDEDQDGVPDRYIIQSELHFTSLSAKSLPTVDGEKPGPGHALFFQAPLGVSYESDYSQLTNLLNGRGYYVHFNSDKPFRPGFVERPERFRYRLMEMVIPTEFNGVYADHADSLPAAGDFQEGHIYFEEWWTEQASYKDPTGETISGNMLEVFGRPLAENIIALVVSPRIPVTDLGRSADESDAVLEVAPDYEYDSQDPEDKEMRHQLPPLVKVTMIAIDEVSASRLALRYGESTPYADKLGINSTWASKAIDYEDDLDDFVDAVRDEANDGVNVQYKIFATTVSILASKYSRNPNPDD